MIAVTRLTLPLFLFLNIVLTQNGWLIGVYFYYFSLIVSFFLLLTTKYSKLAIIFIPLMMIAKILEASFSNFYLPNLLFSGLLFFLVGLVAYADKPEIIRRVIVFFLLINVPIMLLQTSGASSALMYWNTDYSHSLDVLDIAEIGTFKDIPQYPTLFKQIDDLYFQIGQGRPSGLMPANNLLSVIIVFALVMNLYLRTQSFLNIGDIIVNAAVIVSMSKLALFVACFLYFTEIFKKSNISNIAAKKNLLVLMILLCLYYIFFPGVLTANYRLESVVFSFGIRLLDIATTLGANNLLAVLSNSLEFYNPNDFEKIGHTSGLALAVDSYFFVPFLLFIIVLYKKYKNRVKWVKSNYYSGYYFFVRYIICVIFVFSVIPMFFYSPLFMLLLGVGFYPFLHYKNV